MNDNKRYYWLKLDETFFEDDTMAWIEEQENGKDYIIFYLKLCLKSLKDDGKLIRYVGQTLMPYDIPALAKYTNAKVDTVAVAMKLFERIGLVEYLDTGEIYIAQIGELIGSETDVAKRVRKSRSRSLAKSSNSPKMLQCNTDVTPMKQNVTQSKSKSIDIEKEIEVDGGGGTTRARTRGAQPQPQPPSIPDIVVQDSLPPPISHAEAMAYADRIGMRPADAEACYDHFQATDWQNDKIKDRSVRLSRDAVFAKMRRWKVRQARINAENASKRPASVSMEHDVSDYGESDTGGAI